jgi:hypothetical protein
VWNTAGTTVPTRVAFDQQPVNALKVEIGRVHSDQIPNRECNTLPGQKLMYLGTRVDNRGYLQVEAEVLPHQLNSLGLVGVRHGTTVLDSGPIQQPKTALDFAAAGSREQYEIVAGVDENIDGQLQDGEVCSAFSAPALLITQADYETSLSYLQFGGGLVGVASDLVGAFANDAIPKGAGSTPAPITSAELTHPVGAVWTVSCDALTRRHTYSERSRVSDAVENSRAVSKALRASLDQHRSEVSQYFARNPAVDEHVFGPWNWAASVPFSGLLELDLYFAFFHVSIEGTISVTVRRSGLRVTSIVYAGSFEDLYDFNYDGPFPSVHGATVQVGFPTLGIGGRVFWTRVVFEKHSSTFDYDFD